MKKRLMGRVLGVTLAAIMGVSTPVSAFAQEEVGGLLTADVEAGEEEDIEEEEADTITVDEEESEAVAEEAAGTAEGVADTAEEAAGTSEEVADTAEEATAEEAADTAEPAAEDATLLLDKSWPYPADEHGDPEFKVEFVGFGPQVDAAVAEKKDEAYSLYTYPVRIAVDSGKYDSTDEFEITIYVKADPYLENGELNVATSHEGKSFRCHVQEDYHGKNQLLATGCVSKEFIESGNTLTLTATWDMTKREDKVVLDANGGVFDETFYNNSAITYTIGEHAITPIEGKQGTTVEVIYNEDMTQAYIPVMENGFCPILTGNTGFSVDLNGRPYEGNLPILYWNTKRDGSGDSYGVDIAAEYLPEDGLTLYAIYPAYYAAEFILDGESYLGDCWLDPAVKTQSLGELFDVAVVIHGEEPFQKEGQTLSWYLDEDYTISADFAQQLDSCNEMDEVLKVYGKWTGENSGEVKEPETGTVFFENIEGASSAYEYYDAENGVKLEVGETLDLSGFLFTKDGYSFDNWTAVIDGKTKSIKKNAKIKKLFKNDGETFTLSANWTRNNYKITYSLNGGKQDKTAPKNYNVETEVQLLTPAKTGFVFKGWDIIKDGRAVTDAAELAAIYDAENNRIRKGNFGNLTLSAKLVPFEYKIVFHVEGHDEPIMLSGYGDGEPLHYKDTVNFNNAAIKIEEELLWHETKPSQDVPNRDLKIIGFSRTEGGKVDFDLIKNYTKLTDTEPELHLYAVTEDNTYYINYNLDSYEGATLTKPIYTFKGGNKKFDLPKAKCPGYKFYGWEFDFSRNSDKTLFYSYIGMYTSWGYFKFAKTVAENVYNDIEVYPHFEPNKFKVYVSPNGSGVYEEKEVMLRDGNTDWKTVKVTGKRAYGELYYDGGLASDWYNESMEGWWRPGYDFVGYSENPKATSEDEIFKSLDYSYFNKIATSGSGTIYCIWKPSTQKIDYLAATLFDGKEIIDEFYRDYDQSELPVTVTHGESLKLGKVELEGYDFLGWKFNDPDSLDRFTKVTKKGGYITAINAGNCCDIEIYPEFRRCRYDLYFDANGGKLGGKKSGLIKKKLDYSEDVSALVKDLSRDKVVRKGYKLVGFALDPKAETGVIIGADGKPIYRNHSLVLNGNKKLTLYAIWKKN